jgi:arylsulfatase
MSDNGACPYRFNHTPDRAPGPSNSYRTYDSEWANASNTPFRLYKQWSHEGGIASPFIVRWPAGIETRGARSDQVGHLIDLMPTLVEVSGAEYPSQYDGHPVLPMEGISLLPQLKGAAAADRKPIFWEFRGNRAVRDGRFKLVAERSKEWELYDMRSDRVELEILIERYPERAAAMAKQYARWAARTGARSNDAAVAMSPSTQPR